LARPILKGGLERSVIVCITLFAKYNQNTQVEEDEMGMACTRMEEKRAVYGILVGKTEGKSPLGRPRCRRVDNIKIDPRERGWNGMDWIDLAQE
jgi:hypothetical protein